MKKSEGNNRLLKLGDGDFAIYSLIESSRIAFDKHTKLTCYRRGYEIITQFHNPLLAKINYEILTDEGAEFCLLQPWTDQRQFRLAEINDGNIMMLAMN